MAIPELVSHQSSPDDFLNGKIAANEADVLSYRFVVYLMSSPPRFEKLLVSLSEGKTVEQSLTNAYGQAPNQLAAGWLHQVERANR